VKVQVEVLGLPTLSRLIGKKSTLEFEGASVNDLVAHIVRRHGRDARKILLDKDGELDLVIQVMINDEGFLPREEYGRRELKEDDQVRFMLLVGGG
jgi:sulfur carrier protein ThiS